MAERRTTALMDDFERADELWPPGILPPWYQVPGTTKNPELSGGTMAGTEFPSAAVSAYYSPRVIWGPQIQIWGIQSGSAALADTWRFGIFTITSIAAGQVSGYQCLPWDAVGDDVWLLRRHDAGTDTVLENPSHTPGGSGQIAIMEYNENTGLLQTYHSEDAGATYHLVNNVIDNTHNGPWYAFFGMTGVETGWEAVGGGQINKTQIYRYVSN